MSTPVDGPVESRPVESRPVESRPVESGPTLSRRQTNIMFVTILLGILLAALDQTVVSTALPTIVGELGGADHVSWVVTSYVLTQTIATLLAGKLGDLLGRKLIFSASVVVFLVGSALCGLSGSLTTLIVWRALQGIGAGGLTVTATALIGDLIPLRERGKYQGALGAVFGVSTVVGPLIGGLLTDQLSWRWVFYVNLPVGIVVLALAARTIPRTRTPARPMIDYLGIVLITVGAGALVLATSIGGSSYPWLSVPIVGLYALGAVAILVFVLAEQRAADPMLPMRMFRGRVFSVSLVLAFIVGFAMLGSVTYLPIYLQYVQGVSATESGVRTLPMVLGLFTMSMTAGRVVARTGRYKLFPVAGSVVMAVGLFLLSRLGVGSGFWTTSGAMFVLGLGIGLSMQVLTTIVQNTARYDDLGVATSAVTFFRTMGSSVGTAVFGALYASALGARLPAAVAASGLPTSATSTPSALHAQPAASISGILDAYADTLQSVFLYAVPVAVVAFLVSLLLKEVPMRGMSQASASDVGDGFGMPNASTSEQQLETALSRLLRREGRTELPRLRAESGSALGSSDGWCVSQVRIRRDLGLAGDLESIAARVRVPPDVLRPAFASAVEAGYLTGPLDDPFADLVLTPLGTRESDTMVAAVKAWIADRLGAVGGDDPARLDQAFERLARAAFSTDERHDPRPVGRAPAALEDTRAG